LQSAALGRPVFTQVGPKVKTMGNRTLRLSNTRSVLINSVSAITTLSLGSSAFAAGDRAVGEQFFATHCSACHATEPGVNKIGPSLAGVVGCKSGSEPSYNYSAALKSANITWDEKTLDQWLQNPTGDVRGCSLPFLTPKIARTSLRTSRL
jgi:cytochrome c